ncbi:MAG TPA: porin family protein [Gammaproteobacteria bacterium]|nr:porin family protein [Gammaproteobacteria bacterium]
MQRIRLFVAASVLLASGAAFADSHHGVYFGAGLGDFSSSLENVNSVGDLRNANIDFDRNRDASKIFAGWRFNPFVAVQLDRFDFGKSSSAQRLLNVSAETTGYAPSIAGTLPLGPIELFARAGIIYYDLSVTDNSGILLDTSGHDPLYGAGIGITLVKHLSLRAEYERIDIQRFDNANSVWLTAAWRF